jgi:hypothetical protein
VYLDNASSTQKPRVVPDAEHNIYSPHVRTFIVGCTVSRRTRMRRTKKRVPQYNGS